MAHLTLRHRLARIHPFVWIGAVAVIAGLVAWPLGGWDTVEVQSLKIPDAAAGTVVPGHQFSTQIDSAEITSVHPDGVSEPKAGWEYLVLSATLTNETAETEFSVFLGTDFDGVVTVDDGAEGWGTTALDSSGHPSSGKLLLRADGTSNPDLQPRVPAPVSIVWEVPVGTWSPGDPLTVGIVDRTAHACTLEVGTCYGNPNVTANVHLTVTGDAP